MKHNSDEKSTIWNNLEEGNLRCEYVSGELICVPLKDNGNVDMDSPLIEMRLIGSMHHTNNSWLAVVCTHNVEMCIRIDKAKVIWHTLRLWNDGEIVADITL